MKSIIFFLTLLSSICAQPYTFLVNKYDKELELEAKIIAKIAESATPKKIVLFIPNMTNLEKRIYSKIFTLGKSCQESNFIFVKTTLEDSKLCTNENKLYFTNNYKKLLAHNKYFGAFFWSKSRPNIVFVKKRINQLNIALPNSYKQFVEDL